MSRLGKKPIPLPSGVSVDVSGRRVAVKGGKGELKLTLPDSTAAAVDGATKQVLVTRQGDHKQARANHGLARSLLANMVQGVSQGFEQRLEIYGTGYNCKLQGASLLLNVGFTGRSTGRAAQFEIPVPKGLEVIVEAPAARSDSEPAKILIKGIDRQQVGQFAAMVRAIRKTEPYKGKGIRYSGEQVIRKQGKALSG